MQMPLTHPPRFRDTNLEIATLEDAAQSVGGVLTDRLGRGDRAWASFSSGSDAATEGFFGAIPTAHLERMVEPLRRGEPVDWHTVGLELEPLTLADARDRDSRIARLSKGCGSIVTWTNSSCTRTRLA